MGFDIEKLTLEKIGIYEVDEEDYRYYVKRIPDGICWQSCQTDKDASIIYTIFCEFGTNMPVYGTSEKTGEDFIRFYIYNFLPEEKINPPIITNNITVTDDFYKRFLQSTGQQEAFKQIFENEG